MSFFKKWIIGRKLTDREVYRCGWCALPFMMLGCGVAFAVVIKGIGISDVPMGFLYLFGAFGIFFLIPIIVMTRYMFKLEARLRGE